MSRREGTRKVVIAARHPGGSAGTIALAEAARREGVDVECIATEPAFSSLKSAGVGPVYSLATAPARYPRLAPYRGPERLENEDMRDSTAATRFVVDMADWLQRYLAESRPDAVLMTDANEQLGVDQVIAVAARRLGIPSARVRDARGIGRGVETAVMRGVLPETIRAAGVAARYFEIDGEGARMSVDVLGIPPDRVVALNALFTLDRLAARTSDERYRAARAALGVPLDTPVVVYFARPSGTEAAAQTAFEMFLAALRAAGFGRRGVVLATQEHPREDDPRDGRLGLNWTATLAAREYDGPTLNLTPPVVVTGSIGFEQTLMAADVFVSTYSNSCIEATALGATAHDAVPAKWRSIGLFNLCAGPVKSVVANASAGAPQALFNAGGAVPSAERVDDLAKLLSDLVFVPEHRTAYFDVMRSRYNIGTACRRILAEMLDIGTAATMESRHA